MAASELATARPRSLWQWALKITSSRRHAGDQALEHRADLVRRGEAHGVGQVDRGGAGGDRGRHHLGRKSSSVRVASSAENSTSSM
jgi:hypothetical protein